MGEPSRLQHVQYYDQQMAAARKLIDNVVHDAKVWDQMEGYERHGRLEYFALLPSFLASVRRGFERGRLTKRQIGEFRTLDRLAKDALGTIKTLRARYEADERHAMGQDIGPLVHDARGLNRCLQCERYTPDHQAIFLRRRSDDPDVEELVISCQHCDHERVSNWTNGESRALREKMATLGSAGLGQETYADIELRVWQIEGELRNRFEGDST